MALCSLHVVFTSNGRVWNKGNGEENIITGKQCIEMMCYHEEIDTAAYAKMIHRDLFENVRFPKGKIFEDIGTSYLLFDQCDKIICNFAPKYYYIIRENSIVTSSFNEKKLDLIEMTNQMANYVDEKYPDLKEATLRRRGYAYFSTLNQMLDVTDSYYIDIRQRIISFLRRNSIRIIRNERTPKRDKVAYTCLLLGFPFYKFAWKLYIYHTRG